MNDLPAFTADAAADADAADDAAFYRAVLHELIHTGVDAARVIRGKISAEAVAVAQGDAAPGAGPMVELVAALDVVSRMIRRTIRLAEFVSAPKPVRAAADGRACARRQILRDVGDRIGREVPEGSRAALRAELLERLDGLDVEDDLRYRPVVEVIRDLSRDLGLETGFGVAWPRRTPSEAQALAAVAARAPVADGLAGWGGEAPPFWRRE